MNSKVQKLVEESTYLCMGVKTVDYDKFVKLVREDILSELDTLVWQDGNEYNEGFRDGYDTAKFVVSIQYEWMR